MDIISLKALFILFEISIISIIISLFVILRNVWRGSGRSDRITLFVIVISGLLLRLAYSAFAPLREDNWNIVILRNYYYNFLNNNFWDIPHRYHSSFGFVDYIFNKIFFIIGKFDVYTVYYANILVSLLVVILIYYLSQLVFENSGISLISAAVYAFFPAAIKIIASEILFIPTSFFFLLGAILFMLALRSHKPAYIALFLGIYVANIFDRLDVTLFNLVLLSLTFSYLMISSGKFRLKLRTSRPLQIALALIVFSGPLLLIRYSAMTPLVRLKDLYWGHVIYLFRFLNPVNYFNDTSLYPPVFLKYYLAPAYFHVVLLLLPAALFVKKDRRIYYLIALFGYMHAWFLFSHPLNLDSIRNIFIYLPVMAIILAWTLYGIVRLFTEKNWSTYIIILIIFISVWQNSGLLLIKFAHRHEQEFIIDQVAHIPENSLVITFARDNPSHINDFPDFRQYKYAHKNGYVFPHYLLAGRNIGVMDLYSEYDPDVIDNYGNIYYFRSLEAYHAPEGPRLTRKFEVLHDLTPVAAHTFKVYDLDNGSIDSFLKNNSRALEASGVTATIGLYKLSGASAAYNNWLESDNNY